MAYLGRKQLGDEFLVLLQCKTGASVPTAPDACPYLDFWLNGTTLAATVRMAPTEKGKIVGAFHYGVFLDETFSEGYWQAVMRYTLSSVPYQQVDTFRIIPGGHADGPIVAIKEYRKAGANFIVRVTKGGKIKFGRNPQVN